MLFCIFSAQYLPHMGGVENYTYHLAKELVQKGHKAVVVTSLAKGLSQHEWADGIEIFRLPGLNLLNGRYPVLNSVDPQCGRIVKKLRRYPIDLVIVNTRFYLLSVFGMRFARKNGFALVAIEHGTGHLTINNWLADRAGEKWEHWITKVGRRYCNDYYGVSKAACRWLGHFKIRAKGVLYNAIDGKRAEELIRTSKNDFRKKYSIPESAKVIAFTGRLIEEKGIRPLVEAVEEICAVRKDVYLVLAGDGDLAEYVRQHSSSRIIPTGRLGEQDVWNLLLGSDIFCLPSVSEGFPTSLLEAAVCGCYLITTRRGGSRELITGKEYGMIIQAGTKQLVRDALLRVLDDEEYRAACANRVRKRVLKNYTWEVTAERVVQAACRMSWGE